MFSQKRRTLLTIFTALALLLGGIGYTLADRYLIQHVEIADVSAYRAQAALPTATFSSALSVQTAGLAAAAPVSTATAQTTATSAAVSDDWNYQSDSLSITVRQVQTGSGSDLVTYFVADVIVTDATQLQNAFANNSFGRNIIDTTSSIAGQNNAILAINGDYYGFRTDGIIIRNGVIYRDAPARVGLAFYLDGSLQIYDETSTSAQALLDAGVWNTLSFGPALIDDGVMIDNSGTVNIDNNLGNHPVSGSQPRTGIGIIENKHFVFVVVDGRSPGYSTGVTLNEFAQIFASLGCSEAYNLDGGGSSTMYFQGRVVNNPLGRNRERGTSDILLIAR